MLALPSQPSGGSKWLLHDRGRIYEDFNLAGRLSDDELGKVLQHSLNHFMIVAVTRVY